MVSNRFPLPPRSLVALIIGITVVPLATLLWLGWRLLEQDRMLEAQRVQQRVERTADLVVAALQRTLSSSAQRLAAGSKQWPEGAVAVTFRGERIEVHPKERVAYLPVVPTLREAPAATFTRGEDLEFRQHDSRAAVLVFRQQAKSSDPAVRAGALLRLARNLRGSGQSREALASYSQLQLVDDVSAGGVPVALVARYAVCKLLEEDHRQTQLREEAQRLDRDLHSGRWALTGPVYWLYSGDAARWRGTSDGPRQAEILAEAVETLWQRRSAAASGQETLAIEGQPLTVLWHASGDLRQVLIASTGFVESQWLAASAGLAKEQRISIGLRDSKGNMVFGALGKDAPKVTRNAAESALPWSVVASSLDAPGQDPDFALRRKLLIAGFVLLVAMALLASYLIFRAVSREVAVAELQSDFVAAVSHEFRTPLTTLRQFTDMLREHPNLSDERRVVCYEAQARATERLTRLVESVLDFGRMEAGARPYRFEPRDCSDLVSRVVEEFRGEAQASGFAIKFQGNGPAPVEADGEALARAVWNLLDNAVKYSPGGQTVEVALARRDTGVAISVHDYGIGIPAHERAAVFGKFHRGEQARTQGIKGTGIGLAMVDHIVRAHHGHVEVESEPGTGSTFRIVLPVRG